MAKLAPSLLLTFLLALVARSPRRCDGREPVLEELVNDYWADNRVDKIYDISCYREAMEKLRDVQEYSDAQDDLRRTLLLAIRDNRSNGGFGDTTDEDRTAAAPVEDEGGGAASSARCSTSSARRTRTRCRCRCSCSRRSRSCSSVRPAPATACVGTRCAAAGSRPSRRRATRAPKAQGEKGGVQTGRLQVRARYSGDRTHAQVCGERRRQQLVAIRAIRRGGQPPS